ncbi:MAG TPA: BTAD domain-containing putative transcriptional regulator [Trebonia sp.]|nr:BTAD domain-containing putative transcriptional regulator [Trebonia sp.]
MRIGLLGTLTVQDDTGRPVRVGGQRVRALLILLAIDAGQVVPAWSLIDRLWGEGASSRPADAANALQSLVSRLRAALRDGGVAADVIESSPAGYRLAVAPQDVDAIAFQTSARAGARALAAGNPADASRTLRAALSSWRGPALAEVADEGFALAVIAGLEEARSTAQLDRIEADLALGEPAGTVAGLRDLIRADPLAERPRLLLMQALAETGRHAEALAAYHDFRGQLAEQLGMDPSPAFEQAYLSILRHDTPSGAGEAGTDREPHATSGDGRAHGRPRSALNSFVGRDDDTAGVLKKLAEYRLVTLTGPGGVGKTRLANEVCARAGGQAWFAELAPVTDPEQVPAAVLSAIDGHDRLISRQMASSASPLDRLADALTAADAVLILDNCEHVIEAVAGLAARVLGDCPKITVLATSREPLRITGEALWPVAPLQVPPTDEAVHAYPAAKLLEDRVAAVVPGFAVEAGNAGEVARLCRALDGMPLAIELAAPWLRTLTPSQLAERLDDRFALLTGGSRSAMPRHQTLRAVVDWSWDLLSEAERALARRLAVFPAGATLAAAEQVCADSEPGTELPRALALPALSSLVGKSLVTVQDGPHGTEPRYVMLETVRAYGLEKLARAGEEDRVKGTFARYYLDLAQTADPMLRTRQQVRWFRTLLAEQDNLHAALRWVISRRDAETSLLLVRALSYFWVQLGHGDGDVLAKDTLALDLPQAEILPMAEAKVVCTLIAAGWSWEVDTIRQPLADALEELGRWSQEYRQFHPLAALAEPMLALYDGDHEGAIDSFEKYLTVPDPWMRAMARLYRGSYTGGLGIMDNVEEDCQAALEDFRALGDDWGVSVTLAQLVEYKELRGDHAASIVALNESAELGRELGTWADLPYIGGRLATVWARSGDLARAWQELDKADRAAIGKGYVDSTRWLGLMRAEIAWRAGDMAQVTRSCAVVLDDIAGHRAAWWEALRAQVKARLAMVAITETRPERARELLVEAFAAATNWVERPPLAAVMDAIAGWALAVGGNEGPAGDPELAARLLGAAHAVRGAFDESSPDAPALRAATREILGEQAFAAAYQGGLDLGFEAAVALARETLGLGPAPVDLDRDGGEDHDQAK